MLSYIYFFEKKFQRFNKKNHFRNKSFQFKLIFFCILFEKDNEQEEENRRMVEERRRAVISTFNFEFPPVETYTKIRREKIAMLPTIFSMLDVLNRFFSIGMSI